MPLNKNLALLLFVSVGLALLIYWFGLPSQWNLSTTKKAPAQTASEQPEYQISNLTSEKFTNEGKLHSKLKAEQLDFFATDKRSVLHKPDINLFDHKDTNHIQDASWHITAIQASSVYPNDVITLKGDIQARKFNMTHQAEVVIYADQMLLDTQANTITSDSSVLIMSEDNHIRGLGLTAELDRHFLQLHSDVKSRYQQSEKQDMALDKNNDPVFITADRFSFDEARQIAIYYNDVLLQQGPVTIRADRLELIQTEESGEQVAYAFGNPAYFIQKSVQKDDIHAQAMRFEYNSSDKKLKMFDNARLSQGQTTFEGAYIFYDTEDESVGAESKQDTRVRMVLPAREDTTKSSK